MKRAERTRLSRRRFLQVAAGGIVAAPFIARSPSPTDRFVPLDIPASAAPRLTSAPVTHVSVPGLTAQGQPLRLSASTSEVYQGGAFRVRIPGATSGTATIFGRDYPLETDGDSAVGYVGIGVLDPPGPTVVEAEAIASLTGRQDMDRPITVLETDWTVAHIWVPPGPGGGDLLDPAVLQEELAFLREVYGGVSPREWDEPWISPIDVGDYQRITSYFGEQRSFNGGPVGGHHGGTDFGAVTGTPVKSTNAGTVVVAEELAVRGNMVIVDHGTGVFSGYAHLSELNVAEGETVEKGQVVGLVGSTGLSTGPHLHWEQSVMGVLVDGLRWLDGTQGF